MSESDPHTPPRTSRVRMVQIALVAATVAVVPVSLVSWYAIQGYEDKLETAEARMQRLEQRTQELLARNPTEADNPDALRADLQGHVDALVAEKAQLEQQVQALQHDREGLLQQVKSLETERQAQGDRTPDGQKLQALLRERDALEQKASQQSGEIDNLWKELVELNRQINLLHKRLWEVEVKKGWNQKIKRE